ncbi:hypothetical protein [Noviherbaspirillum galbum]|uniref:Uncharacterized protein n=1 Tax=Noviherbaspirillum galbum TaxID=2709383 RepID=A0A6B3SZX6_9BURK|nr:hypothetical protein [Noviherbaspirillum galbum]NEX64879.1 hypothetical protein [Noviherbaspirillum galbum]
MPLSANGADTGVQATELDSTVDVDGTDLRGSGGKPIVGGRVINRSIAKHVGTGSSTNSSGRAKSNPEVVSSFDGLNLRQQRLANNGNQFTVEPPDQGLCAGNGYVLESVNDVLQVFDANGNPLTGVVDLNSFHGYIPAINRGVSPTKYGPSITDPVCLFDKDTQRWFHVVLTLDRVGTSSALSGKNHLDIAVSTTASPLDPWIIYRLPVQNDGTDGTPNHQCDGGPCLGDYPHIGVDANAIYLTTNEFSLFGDGFYGAQIYALSKRALANRASGIPVALFNTFDPSVPYPGFTVWPAQSLTHDLDNNGTEFMLSSLAVFENSGNSNQIVLWKLTNTQSIDSATPALQLTATGMPVATYGVPPSAKQKAGSTPLRDCIANAYNDGCNALLGVPRTSNPIYDLDSSDSRMQQVFYANGKLWGALGTAVQIAGDTEARAGIAYYVVNPNSAKVTKQGVIAMAGNNVTYPAIAVTESGRGVIGFTLVGNDHFPTAAYAALDALTGAGDVHIAKAGVGPADGFSGYLPYSDRPRWGDYGAAASDGTSIWIANEYIAQTCTEPQFMAAPFGSCGGTRTSLGNWATRITRLNP